MTIRLFFEFLHRNRVLVQTAFVVAMLAVYVWLVQDEGEWVKGFEDHVTEILLLNRPPLEPPPETVIIYVSENTFPVKPYSPAEIAQVPDLAYLTQKWPWNNALWAHLTQNLLDAGAGVVALDLFFKGTTPGDAELAEVIAENQDRVVLPSIMDSTLLVGTNQLILDPERSLLPTTGSADVLGFTNYPDTTVRMLKNWLALSILLPESSEGNAAGLPRHPDEFSFSWLAAKKFMSMSPQVGRSLILRRPKGGLKKMVDAPQRDPKTPMMLNYYGPPFTITSVRLENVLTNWNTTFLHGEYFKGKAVFIGTRAWLRFNDFYTTPLGSSPGVEIQATSFANLIHTEWLRPAPDWVVLLLAFALSLMALAVSLSVHQVLIKMGLFLSLGAIFLEVTQHLFWSWLIVVPVAGAALILISCGIFGTLYDYMLTQYERQRMLGMFESMVSPGVAGLMLSQRGDFEKRLGGQRQEVIVLFCDIRRFTVWSEKVGPEALVAQLNEYYSQMVGIVQEHGGTVQKYIGDALMAAWGDVRAQPPSEGATHAVHAALRMVEALRKLNLHWAKQPGREQLSFGIGINHGECVVGQIGHPRRLEFTVLGDPVNLASRLESATKQCHQTILVGQSIYEMTKREFSYRLAEKMQVMGKSHAVAVYAPMGEGASLPPVGVAQYNDAIESYYARDFVRAAELFRLAQERFGGDDYLCTTFLKRCEHFQKNPPPPDWDGTWVLTEK